MKNMLKSTDKNSPKESIHYKNMCLLVKALIVSKNSKNKLKIKDNRG